ncbi:FAD-dependent oxidoreductase [Novosphingobium sp. ST904]|uniref:FAD-dependent oxidoreductase n=1 Tax=Novosphingobium sp. ST904 TaxID=1684385 RepID=UPI0006C86568|nr:FAD-dependent oxidoreductase [Novosphingobium sp. ST904]KPH58130.1 salicylate 1-monooxygenase [Novosphingobium sp. ST904]TCM41402.1 salicylate hydroxylase [Novosphingobium sp. ST904]
MARAESIVIVGGGIAGMTAAAALAQEGFKVTLLESAREFGEIGAGVTLSPNAMKGLDFIGVCEEAASAGVEPSRQRIQHWQDGRTIVAKDRSDQRDKYGAPYVTIHRADLHEVLLGAARRAGVDLRTSAGVVSSEGNTVTLVDGSTVTGDLIVGADGVKSVIRERFETTPPHFTGHVAWRCLVPVTPGLQELSDFPGIIIGPGAMITRYNIRGSTAMNLVFFSRQDGWNEEGWTTPVDPGEVRKVYEGWCTDAQKLIAAACEQPMYKWAINARTALPGWIIDDNVTLIGDAAHAMTPFLGHGAACGIEDGVVLARALAASATIGEGLRRYEAARHERATFIQAESNANADRMQGQNTDFFGLEGTKDEESLGLFNYDCRTVPV